LSNWVNFAYLRYSGLILMILYLQQKLFSLDSATFIEKIRALRSNSNKKLGAPRHSLSVIISAVNLRGKYVLDIKYLFQVSLQLCSKHSSLG
jgi:hypothetical protein